MVSQGTKHQRDTSATSSIQQKMSQRHSKSVDKPLAQYRATGNYVGYETSAELIMEPIKRKITKSEFKHPHLDHSYFLKSVYPVFKPTNKQTSFLPSLSQSGTTVTACSTNTTAVGFKLHKKLLDYGIKQILLSQEHQTSE